LTEVSVFRVMAATPLKPASPATGDKITGFGDKASVQFRWMQPQGDGDQAASNGEHAIEVARDANFKNVVATQLFAASTGVATIKDLPLGEFFWRIRSKYADISVMSASERFTVAQVQRPTLTLTYPDDKKTVEVASQMRLSWTSDAEGLEYAFELQGADGKEVASQRSPANGYVWKKPPPGAFRWRVKGLSKGQEVAESPWRTFSVFEGSRIALRAPAREQEIFYWEKPTAFSFRWDEDPMVTKHPDYGYRVELAADPEFKTPVLGGKTRELTQDSQSIMMGQGKFTWRVSVLDGSGQVVKTSEPSRFAYGVYPTLKAPLATGPSPAAVFNMVEQDKNPVATWSPVKDAEAYELVVTTKEAPRAPAAAGATPPASAPQVAYKGVLTQTSFELKGLKPSDYTWTVRAIDKLKRPGEPSAARPFTVTYGEILESPEVTSPEVQ
jgi:hypothetical protein